MKSGVAFCSGCFAAKNPSLTARCGLMSSLVDVEPSVVRWTYLERAFQSHQEVTDCDSKVPDWSRFFKEELQGCRSLLVNTHALSASLANDADSKKCLEKVQKLLDENKVTCLDTASFTAQNTNCFQGVAWHCTPPHPLYLVYRCAVTDENTTRFGTNSCVLHFPCFFFFFWSEALDLDEGSGVVTSLVTL